MWNQNETFFSSQSCQKGGNNVMRLMDAEIKKVLQLKFIVIKLDLIIII